MKSQSVFIPVPVEEASKIPLTRGQFAIVDKSDFEWLSTLCKWQAKINSTNSAYYATSRSGLMARVIMNAKEGEIVDHRNGDTLDNRRENLRKCTQSQNAMNRVKTPNKYLRGVYFKYGKFRAHIKMGGKQVYLGTFDTEIDAHSAYLKAAKELHGDFVNEKMLNDFLHQSLNKH